MAAPAPSTLTERWADAGGRQIFYRSRLVDTSRSTIVHLHGFAISGTYMLPTARLLADEFTTYVPDLPGFGRSPRSRPPLDISGLADATVAFLDAVGEERVTVVGNSLGCAILAELAHRHPDRLDRAVVVSPAGGRHSQPLLRAVSQLLADAPREPFSMAAIAVPDYLRFGVTGTTGLFRAMTRFPAFDRLITLPVPVLAVLGGRDPLLPPASRVREVALSMDLDTLTLALIKDAAHAINYSHPRELAALIRAFLRDDNLTSTLDPDGDLSPVAVLRRQRPGTAATDPAS